MFPLLKHFDACEYSPETPKSYTWGQLKVPLCACRALSDLCFQADDLRGGHCFPSPRSLSISLSQEPWKAALLSTQPSL